MSEDTNAAHHAGASASSTARRQLGAGAVLTVAEAARLLPFREADAVRWLHERKLARPVPGLPGRRVVRWLDVLDALAEPCPEPVPKREPLPRAGLSRGGKP
jgi:hypothetical protein